MSLTVKQQAFVDAYDGNATSAARAAGFTGSDASLAVTGSRLLKRPEIREALSLRSTKGSAKVTAKINEIRTATAVATRLDRQAFWTRTMLSEDIEYGHRLKASELLGRSEVDFGDKLQVEGKLTLEQMVARATAGRK